MMVDFPAPEGPTRAVTVPGSDVKLTSCKTSLRVSYAKLTCSIFGIFLQNFSCALQPSDGFGYLRADRHDLKNGRNQKSEEGVIREPLAQGHAAGKYLVPAKLEHQRANDAQQHRAREAHQRSGCERLQHVVQQSLHAGRKDFFFPLF